MRRYADSATRAISCWEMNKKRKHPVPAIRRFRRAALMETALILALGILLAVVICRGREAPLVIREERILTPSASIHIIETTPAPTAEPEEEESAITVYPVNLNADFQQYVIGVCEEYGIDPALGFAVIVAESECNPAKVGDEGTSYGLMQVQEKWHIERMARLGVIDIMDAEGNVRVGIDFLAELLDEGKGVTWALMAYNGWKNYADDMTAKGEVSAYARKVLALAEEYREEITA